MSAEYQPSNRARWSEGQPISVLMSRALDNPNLISLAAGFVDNDTLPVEPARQALSQMLDEPNAGKAALQYGSTPGFPPLREMLLEHARRADGLDVSPPMEQIVITAGSNQLLHLVSESLFNPGDIVLCSSPSYFVYLGLLAGLGVRAEGIASDDAGMIPEALEETLARLGAAGELTRVKAIYLVPYFDNPGGVTMPLERRASVVDIAKRWSRRGKIHVISDEAYRELRCWGDDIPSTRICDEEGDTVVVAGTFSKSFSPGIRVGWGILPRHLAGPVNDQKGNVDFGSPNFNQHLMAKLLEMGLFQPHVERICDEYRRKLTAMLEAADRYLAPLEGVQWFKPAGGLYVWVRLPEHIETGMNGKLFDTAMREGVFYVPGEYCYPTAGEPVSRCAMRLSFGVQSCEKIREGVEKLARAIAAVAE